MEADGGGMPPFKDPAIKLFGRKIALPDSQIPPKPELKTNSCKKDERTNMEIESPRSEGNSKDQSSTCQDTAERSNCNGQIKEAQTGSKGDQMDSSNDQEKALKKPDKVIPCPRCNSLETKFCYFNNYNVNQPRHFCKNCQRYWTAGGTMRNVPIGAGRRKNKHLASQYRQIMVSHDGIPVTRVETHDQQPPEPASASMSCSPGNGMVLKFGPDQAPLCESMQNVNLGDQHGGDATSCGSPPMDETPENVRHKKDQVDSPAHSKEQSSTTAHHHPMQCFPVAPVIVPWSWNGLASTDPNQVQWCPTTPMLAVPGFSPPGVPLHFLPASYLSCMPMWPNGCHSPSSSSTSCSSGNGTPTLGKHCRDTSLDDEEKVEKSIVIPKTLRIDNSNEALRSPLWSALGLKQEPGVLVTKGSIFKTFQSKGEGKVHVQESAHILEANPAALSRSQTFQEGS